MPVTRCSRPREACRGAHRHACAATLALALALVQAAGAAAAADPATPQSAADAAAAQPPAAVPSFDILEFVVEGNTVLPVETIERAVHPFLGPARRFDDVEAARKALEDRYRSAGYGLATVDIPEQRADGGRIRLLVTEGRIARTRVTGSRWYSQGYILERVDAAAEGRVPHLPTLQAQLLDVNRSADRRVTPLLRAGTLPGTTEVDLAVQDRLPLHGSVALNNQASRNTSATRLQLALSHDNLFQRDHNLGLQLVASPEKSDEVRVLTASYSLPRGPAGLESLAFSATRSDSAVPAGVGSTRLFGRGRIFALRRSRVLDLAEDRFHLLTLGLEYKDMTDTVQAGEGAGFDTPVTYLPLSLSWNGSQRTGGGDWQFGATLSGGLRGLVNRQAEFADKRYQAKASYALLRLDARHQRVLPWQGLRLRAALETQWAPQPLIANEQFVLGGASSVRGYLEAEAVGDFGARASVQLGTPELAPALGWKAVSTLGLHAFVDAGLARLHKPLPQQASRFRLAGAGFGAQMALQGWLPLNLALELAWPLIRREALGSEGLRAHASASVGF